VINAQIEVVKRDEERMRKAWNHMLKSHPKGRLLRNIVIDEIFRGRAKVKRINKLVKDEELRETTKVTLNELAYYHQKNSKTTGQKERTTKTVPILLGSRAPLGAIESGILGLVIASLVSGLLGALIGSVIGAAAESPSEAKEK